MEKNESLHKLSQIERDISYAATDVAGEDGEFWAHDLACDNLVRDISHAMYHRGFKSLLGKEPINLLVTSKHEIMFCRKWKRATVNGRKSGEPAQHNKQRHYWAAAILA